MSTHSIRIFGDPVLRTPTAPVETFDADLERLVDDMIETMYAAPGVGLAANQIGVSLQIFVYDIGDGVGHVINPVLEISEEMQEGTEGCLSVPEIYAEVERPSVIRARWQDVDGQTHEEEMDGLMATCLQHEMDHLEGILFIDHLSRLKRDRAVAKVKKQARAA